MRVQVTNAPGAAGVVSARRQAAGGAFSVADPEISRAPSQGAPRAVASLGILMALQEVDDPTERRRRSVRHGRMALDALDALKVGLVAGELDRTALTRLKAIAEGLGEPSGDSQLDAVMAEIALRAAVELAKFR
jgi:hypothetical protein